VVRLHLATAEILALINRAPPPLALLAIDGHSAAGKSSLAKALQAARPGAAIVHTDDFYRPLDSGYRAGLDAAGGYAEYYDWQRLEAEVLRPLRTSRPVRYRKYDWSNNSLGDWIVVEPTGLIIVEGCYSARPELRTYYDAIVLAVASPAERERRQRLRNDASSEWLRLWDAAERYYMNRCRPDTYADLVLFAE
jgi:uridine kinase